MQLCTIIADIIVLFACIDVNDVNMGQGVIWLTILQKRDLHTIQCYWISQGHVVYFGPY